MRLAAPLLATVLLAACLGKAPEEARGPAPAVAEGPFQVATLTTVYAGGVGKELHGYAFVPPDDPGALVVFVRGLKEGARAAHVHEQPSCRSSVVGEKTVAAGAAGARWGDDLPDLEVDAEGNAALAAAFDDPLRNRSLLVHALADAGGPGEEKAGPAVLCGVFEARPWNDTATTLSTVGTDLGEGRLALAFLFGDAYARVALRGLEAGTYLLSAADRATCEGASATAREPWTAAPRLHVGADGAARAAWMLEGDATALRGTPVILHRDGEGRPVACGVLG